MTEKHLHNRTSKQHLVQAAASDPAPVGEPVVNQIPKKCAKSATNHRGVYNSGERSRDLHDDRRFAPLSERKFQEPEGRLGVPTAGVHLAKERRKIVLLIATASDETLKSIFPVVQKAFRRAAKVEKPCALKSKVGVEPQVAATAIASHKCSSNGKPSELPKLPTNLRWPRKKFSNEFQRRGLSIGEFLMEEWSELVAAGFGELRWLRMVDPSAARAVDNYERVLPGKKERRRLPPAIYFLRERERLDRALLEGMDAVTRDPRLLQALAFRVRRETAGKGRSQLVDEHKTS